MIDENILFTKRQLKLIGNLCETMKHWRRHDPAIKFPDGFYEELEDIQDKCTKAILKNENKQL
jgi:hypothetical protein